MPNQPLTRRPPHPLIAKAIEICGTQKRLAKKAGISPPHVNRLLKRTRNITAEAAVGIDRATDGQVPKWKLRPDLFEAPKQKPN